MCKSICINCNFSAYICTKKREKYFYFIRCDFIHLYTGLIANNKYYLKIKLYNITNLFPVKNPNYFFSVNCATFASLVSEILTIYLSCRSTSIQKPCNGGFSSD